VGEQGRVGVSQRFIPRLGIHPKGGRPPIAEMDGRDGPVQGKQGAQGLPVIPM